MKRVRVGCFRAECRVQRSWFMEEGLTVLGSGEKERSEAAWIRATQSGDSVSGSGRCG